MMKLFFDSEFTGLHQNSTLISIAFIAESGEEFYAEFIDYDTNQLNDWIQKNVISNLFLNENNTDTNNIKGTKAEIKIAFQNWIKQFGEIENSIQIWADVPHWDWVLFCELFGGAFGIPKQIHYIPMDIATLLFSKGVDINLLRTKLIDKTKLPDNLELHNALYDAHLVKLLTEKYLNI